MESIHGRGIEGLDFEECGRVSIGWDEWRERFIPLEDEGGSWWHCLDLSELPEGTDPRCVWGEFYSDDDDWSGAMNLCAGAHRPEPIYITRVPCPEGLEVEVWDEPVWTEDEQSAIRAAIEEWCSASGRRPEDEEDLWDLRDWLLEHHAELEDATDCGLEPRMRRYLPDIAREFGMEPVDSDACSSEGAAWHKRRRAPGDAGVPNPTGGR